MRVAGPVQCFSGSGAEDEDMTMSMKFEDLGVNGFFYLCRSEKIYFYDVKVGISLSEFLINITR